MGVKESSEFDEPSKAMLFQGASISQLATLFGLDNRTVAKRIFGVKPCAKRQGHPVYAIKDAAPYLVDPVGDIEAHIKQMNHRDLPPVLLKEFWNGQHARLKFEVLQGYHWPTDRVIEHYSKVFQTFRTHILLATDLVEREAEMTENQRAACRRILDGLMAEIRVELIEKFSNEPKRNLDGTEPTPAEDHGAVFEDERDDAGRDPDDPAYGL